MIICDICGNPDAVTYCHDCDKDLCCDCIKIYDGSAYCPDCYKERIDGGKLRNE